MFAVEIYAAVRRFVFIEGNSRREAARVFGLSRDTIAKMCRYSAPPGYVRTKAPERPKLGPLLPVIDAILEFDKTAPPKQRHTAKRIFERLRDEHDFAGGYTVVKDTPMVDKISLGTRLRCLEFSQVRLLSRQMHGKPNCRLLRICPFGPVSHMRRNFHVTARASVFRPSVSFHSTKTRRRCLTTCS